MRSRETPETGHTRCTSYSVATGEYVVSTW